MGNKFFKERISGFNDSLVSVVAVGLASAVVTILTMSPKISEREQSHSTTQRQDQEARRLAIQVVNRNLQADQSVMDLRSRQVQEENRKIQQKTNLDLESDSLENRNYELIDPTVHDGSRDVYQDIFGSDRIYDSQLSPSEHIETKLRRLKTLQDYDYQQKLVFIESFIQNAYEQGYHVEINQDLEVVKVKKINTDEPYRGTATLDKLLDQQDL